MTGRGKIILSNDTYLKVSLQSSNIVTLSFVENGKLLIKHELDMRSYDSTIHILLPHSYELNIALSKTKIGRYDESQFVNWIILGPYFIYLSRSVYKTLVLTKIDDQLSPFLSIHYITPSSVNLKFKLAKISKVRITIYDISGRRAVSLIDKTLVPGNYSVRINGNKLAPGIYIAELKINRNRYCKKFVMLK